MENKKVTKTFYLILTLIISLIFSSGKAQKASAGLLNKQDLVFFSGDSLSGFPLENEYNRCKQLEQSPGALYEYKYMLKQRETEFVKQKYHINKLPYEQDELQLKEQNTKHVITAQQQQTYRQNNPPQPFASGCNNIDFEDANFTNWIGYEGYNEGTNNPLVTVGGALTPPPTNLNNAETSCQYFAIIANGSTDPNMGITLTSPLGGNCARMGGENRNLGDANTTCTGNGGGTFNYTIPTQCEANYFTYPIGTQVQLGGSAGEVLETTFTVTTQNSAFQYAYLFAYTDNGDHDTTQQPYFKVRVLDKNGQEINCLDYFQQGLGDACGNTHAPPGYSGSLATGGLFYTSQWQVSSLNLLPYLNQAVTVIFTVAGCTVGGHFGYAYVDCACAPQQIIIPYTACQGANTTLIAPPLGGAVYQWTTSGGNIVSGGTNDTVIVSQSGTYSVTITPTKSSINSSGALVTQTLTTCSYKLDTTITLYPNPTVSVNSATMCSGGTTTLNVTGTGSAGPLNYTWSSTAGLTYTSGDTVATANPSTTTVYTITGTSAHGCSDTAVANIIVNTIPPPTFTATTVCQGTPTVFSNATAAGDLYNWDFGVPGILTDVSNQPNPSYTYPSAGTFAVNFTVTTAAGCKSNTTQSVTVNPMPTVHFTSNDACEGSPVNFNNTTANQGSFSNWYWDFGDGNTSPSASPGAYTYTAPAGFSAAGCYSVVLTGTTTTGCVGSFDTIVSIHSNPIAYFTLEEACMGDASLFIDSSFIQNPSCLNDHISFWHYDFGDQHVGTFNAVNLPDTIKYIYMNCGAYNINLTAVSNYGCIGTNSFNNDSVFCLPVVTAPPSFSVCPGVVTTPQTFTSTVGNGGPAYTIWFTNYPATHTGMTIADTLGYDVFPSYNTIPKNLSCSPVTDVIYGIAASSYCIGNIDSLQVTVYPTPFLSHMDSIKVCANQSVVVPAFTVCPAGDTISWTNNNTSIGLAASGTGNIASPFTGTNSTAQIAYAVITAHAEANTCIGPDSMFTIEVNPLPSITVASPAAYCPGDTVKSPQIVSTPTAGVVYNWSVTNNVSIGMPATGSGIPLPYIAPANNSLAVQTGAVTYSPSLNGCAGPPVTETIILNPTPVVTPLANEFYCPQTVVPQINFNCTPTGGTPVFSYSGLGGIGITQTGSIPSFTTINTTILPIVNTITVTATLNGCKGPPTIFDITVYPNPIASFTYTPVCIGKPVNFTDQSSVGGGITITSWEWDMNNDGNYPDAVTQNPQYTVTPAGIDSVGLIVHTSSTPSCSSKVKEPVIINPNPVADFVGFNLKGCNPVNTAYTDLSTVSLGGTISAWNWIFGNGQTSTEHYPAPQVYSNMSVTSPVYYSATLTVSTDKGCTATAVKNNYIEVYPHPVAAFSWGPSDADITEPTITFVNHAIGASTYSPALTYGQYGVQYYLGDDYNTSNNTVYNNTMFNHSYNNPDLSDNYEYYNVTQWVINQYGCKDSVTERVEIAPIVTFYIPNAFTPNGDGTNEGFKGTGIGIKEGTYNLWVFDRWGLMIYHADDLEKPWNGHMNGNDDRPVLQEDVYVWKVKFNDILNKSHEYHGTVTLVK
jgi:gliding motility-associated-like protein